MTSSVRSTTWILLALVALIAGVGLWFASRADKARADAGATESHVAASAEPTPMLSELSDQLERAPLVAAPPNEVPPKPTNVETPPPLEKSLVLRGRVLDLSGQPVADQAVHLRDAPDKILARSLGDGTFTCDAPPRTGTLVADSDRFTCLRGVQLPAADGAFVIVAPTIPVAGFVVDDKDAGIEGASVKLREGDATLTHFPEPLDRTQLIESVAAKTDAQGRFTFEHAVPGAGMTLSARRAGYDDGSIDVPNIPRTDLRIVLKREKAPSRLLKGVVVHRDGKPEAGALVRCGDARTKTDPSGAFALALDDVLDANEPLYAIASGYQAAYVPEFGLVVQRSNQWALDPVRLVLGAESLTIAGRVVDATGKPQEGWVVKLLDGTPATANFSMRASIETQTAGVFGEKPTRPDGAFSIGGLLDRNYTLFAYHPLTLVRIETRAVPAGTQHFDILIPADAFIPSVTGRVLAHDGTPIAEAVVSIGLVTERTRGSSSSISGQPTPTQADGTFALADVPRRFAYLSVGGDHVIPKDFPLESLDTSKALALVVERRCHFRVEGLPADGETRWLAIHDANGKELSIKSFAASGWSSMNRQTVTTAETRAFAVSEIAVEIVMYFPYDTVVAKRALRLTPGEVTVVTW